jgi:hypothetical protein
LYFGVYLLRISTSLLYEGCRDVSCLLCKSRDKIPFFGGEP